MNVNRFESALWRLTDSTFDPMGRHLCCCDDGLGWGLPMRPLTTETRFTEIRWRKPWIRPAHINVDAGRYWMFAAVQESSTISTAADQRD
jgi:hypothetical protein